jgi:hypothetical protein
MKKFIVLLLLSALIMNTNSSAQTIDSHVKQLPSYFSVLTSFGLRPEWDETGKFIAVQFGFQSGSGNAQGIFLFDVDKYEKTKKK